MRVGLDGRAVIVTGAASGIGRAVARLAAEAGATLLVTDRDGPGLAATASALPGGPHAAAVADLADPAAPARIADEAVARLGRIDGLVNAAGMTTRDSLLTGTLGTWDMLLAVNARAPFFLMQAAAADMLGRRASGAVVNVLSVNARCGQPDLAIYAASKGALATLTRNAAHAHRADRIRVNGILLGWAETEAEHRMQAETLGRGAGWLAEAAAGQPLGRLLQPEEAARLAVFLLSDASVPMTGALVDLDQNVPGAPG